MKQRIKGFLAVLLLGSILSTGCTGPEDVPSSGGLPPDSMDGHAILRVVSPPAEPAGEPEKSEEAGVSQLHPYVKGLTADIAAELSTPGMGEYEKAKAAFDDLITHVSIGEPIGLELWRVHGGGAEAIPFIEHRAIGPLRFGVGMCEDNAAALTLLLREMVL